MIRGRGDLRAGAPPDACGTVRADRVLVLTARRGDEAHGCGGLLSRLAKEGARIEVLSLEDEEPGSPREAISARLATAWPDLLLCPSPTETGARAAVFAALHGLLTAVRDPAALPADLRVLLYAVEEPLAPDLLVDAGSDEPRREAFRRLEPADFVLHSRAQLAERLGGRPLLVPVEGGPLVSVVVRTRNRPALLAESLASLAAGTYRKVEVVLVNDGGLPPEHPAGFPFPIRRIEWTERKGRAAAAQAGLEAAAGEYVSFLDDDDLAAPEHLATLVDLVLTSGGRIAYTDAAVAICEPAPSGGWRCVERRLPYSRDFDPAWLAVDNYIPFNTVIAERALLLEAGGLDERLERMEDWDLLVRLSVRAPFRHLPRVTCEYRHFRGAGDHALGADAATPEELSKARALVLGKNLPLFGLETFARAVTRLREEAVAASERAAELEAREREHAEQAREERARFEEVAAELRRVYAEEARLNAVLTEWQEAARAAPAPVAPSRAPRWLGRLLGRDRPPSGGSTPASS